MFLKPLQMSRVIGNGVRTPPYDGAAEECISFSGAVREASSAGRFCNTRAPTLWMRYEAGGISKSFIHKWKESTVMRKSSS